MVLAAGLGQRMRPLTQTRPKPLIEVGGKALLDHALDRLADAGIETAVVNVHYLADLVEAHAARREVPKILISDERARLLETGGGIRKALPLLGREPFLALNSDTLWIEGARPNLPRLMKAWDPGAMDVLLLLAATASSVGYDGRGDFAIEPEGESPKDSQGEPQARLRRRREGEVAPFVYAGVGLFKPELFVDAPEGPFSANLIFDRAIAAGRLYGVRLEGEWLHVGTPEAIPPAEQRLAERAR